MSKKYYWLKLKEDFFRQKEIKKLRKIAGGDTYTIIYLKMQLLSLQNEGILKYEGIEENIAEQIALEIDEDVDNVQITLSFLMANKLIEEISNTDFFLVKANDCIGKEVDSAARVRAYRERKKQEEKRIEEGKNKLLQCNGDVTKSNTEKDIEKDIEKDKKEKKPSSKKIPTQTEIDEVISAYTSNEELKTTLIEFVKFRKSIKKVMTTHALELLIKKLDKLSNDDNTKIEILNESIMNGWNGIFPLKDNSTPKNKGGFNNEPRSNTSKNYEPSKGKSEEEHDAKYWEEQNRILNEMLDF